jgi:hypothetical protein
MSSTVCHRERPCEFCMRADSQITEKMSSDEPEGELAVNISTGSSVIQVAHGCETGDFQTRRQYRGQPDTPECNPVPQHERITP